MSRYVASLVYRKKVGSMARKSILAYCAERANDDGSGVWASKVRISKEVECSKQTVIDTLKSFVDEGLMIEVGKRKSPHGYTIEYAIMVRSVEALEDAFEDPFSVDDARGPNLDGSNELTPRGQATGPQEVKPVDPNRPLTVPKPSTTRDARENDLFSADDQTSEPEQTKPKKPDRLKSEFDEFWEAYPRKAEPDAAFKNYKKARKESDKDTLLAAARAYRREVERERTETKFIKLAKNWLSSGAWREVSAASSENGQYRLDDLKINAKNLLMEGICPPSMKDESGNPNSEARYWLKKFRGRAA